MFKLNNFALALKRSLCVALVSVLSIGYSLGLSFDFQGHYYDRKSYVTYCFYDSTRKILKNEFIDNVGTYNIQLAKNEYEACQIVLRSKFNSTGRKYTVEFSSFKNDDGKELESEVFLEKYILCNSDKYYGMFPDALVPFNSPQDLTLSYQTNWPFYIKVHADENTQPGTYTAQVKVTNVEENGKVELIANVTATVWDFTLPVTPTCDTAFGLGRGNIAKAHGTTNDPEKTQELYEKYYEFMLEHKISPYSLPYDILDERADKYMSDSRVKSFMIPYTDNDELLQKYYNKVSSNPVWAAKGYFYPIDEPSTAAAYETYNKITDRLQRLCPGYNMVTPVYKIRFSDEGKEFYVPEAQKGRSNIVCGISNAFSDNGFIEATNIMKENGSKIWWYVCCGPTGDYCNVFTHWEGIKGRLLLWQQKSLNIQGLLYWDTTYWSDTISPWCDALTTPWTGNDTFGDGALLFNGNVVDVDGPVSSMRFEEISDGIDDYEYLTIAENLFGRDYVDKKIAKVSKSLTNYTLDNKLLSSVRVEIGNDIANAKK